MYHTTGFDHEEIIDLCIRINGPSNLQPLACLTCPQCASTIRVTPARLGEAVRCELCTALVPFGTYIWVTPIAATAVAIEYTGESPGAAFVVVDPSDPASLTALWKARACGASAFPVPVGHEQRILAAAETWLRQVLEKGELGGSRTEDGRPLGPRIRVWQDEPGQLPAALEDLLAAHGVTPMPDSPQGAQGLARGWHGDHPFTTSYAYGFSQPLEEDGRVGFDDCRPRQGPRCQWTAGSRRPFVTRWCVRDLARVARQIPRDVPEGCK